MNFTPLLRLLPPEPAHNLTINLLKTGLVPGSAEVDPRLATQVWGQTFRSPLGLAAGFDKQAEVMSPMLGLGFGFVEVGTLTPEPQPGNPKPRVFRAPGQKAVINRYGFNSVGQEAALPRLKKWRETHPTAALGINLGMNKGETDPLSAYKTGVRRFEELATYLVINLSSPNTQGLRDQQTQGLSDLIKGLKDSQSRPVPLLLKVAPDLDAAQIELIVKAALDQGLDGLIVSNTTLDRPDSLPTNLQTEAGGLSGAPLTSKALKTLRQFSAQIAGRMPLIGVGGIMTGQDAVDRLRAGADLLQVYTGLMYRGPALIREIHKTILDAMETSGAQSPAELKGTAA